MQIFLYVLSIPFLYINYEIIYSDLKNKIIPNKHLIQLLLLIPFYYLYLFISNSDINILVFIWQAIITLVISFSLYNIWIWSAWDAKYLLVLALFIPNIWIIPLIGNIALITLTYLFLYFIRFYLWKCLLNFRYTKSLYINIYSDLKDKTLSFLKHGDWNFYKKIIFLKILKLILLFLIIFVSIRLLRLYIFTDIKESIYYKDIINYLKDYTYYIIFALIGIFVWIIYIIRLIINLIKSFFKKKAKVKNSFILDFIVISIFLVILISFIIYEYRINPSEILSYLKRIFTLYIALYIISKILRYSYKITFQLAEMDIINIKDLGTWYIVDKEYLIKIFWQQQSLWASWHKWILSPDPIQYFTNIKNPIDNETKNKLQKIYKIVSKFHKKNNFVESNNNIKILKTFAFWWYIFIGFIISFFLWNTIINKITSFILRLH